MDLTYTQRSEITKEECYQALIERIPDYKTYLKAAWIDTELGPMIAIGDEEGLYLLEFIERKGLTQIIKKLKTRLSTNIEIRENIILKNIKQDILNYFKNKIFRFSTPIHQHGTNFQHRVWDQLKKIPRGKTFSYLEVAKLLDSPLSFRAVARAIGSNTLAIIVPCHRVINTNGKLGGYAGGIARKQWLLDHEYL